MIPALERFCEIVEKVAGLLLAACTILIVVSSVGRYLFSWPVPDAFDISRLLVGACIMWGFASVGYRGGHIQVDLFVEMMPDGWRRWIDVFAWTLLLVFVVLLVWKMSERVLSAYESNESTFDLRLPVWPLMLLIWTGTAATIVTVAVRLWLVATGQGTLEHPASAEFGADDDRR